MDNPAIEKFFNGSNNNQINNDTIDTKNFMPMDKGFTIKRKPELSPNAIKVLEKRYLKKDTNGILVETPEGMFKRVAKNIASADLIFDSNADVSKTEEEFYGMMANLEFMPNSPTLMNAGGRLQQLSACFVLPLEDSMESIFETIKDTALIHKSGGGTGFSFSKLRPANSPVASTNGVSSGPISFMKVFDSATEAIKQGGTRRGANMAILKIDHPDILDFIICKTDNDTANNFNISIALTENFMQAVAKKESYNLIDPNSKKITGQLQAEEVFDKIVNAAWKNGEPGIVFIDKINADNPTPHIGEIESTNPCGEQPLLAYESCNLGSINLAKMVEDGGVNFKKLKQTVNSAVHFLDNVIDKNKYPLGSIELTTKGNRKIGLGVMGFTDMLIALEIPYGSDKSFRVAEEVMSFISLESKKASSDLAKERGSFPNFKGSTYDRESQSGIRNATTTTIAPTGTISIISNCSSGIEPLFAVSYIRKVMDNEELVEVHPMFKKIAKELNFYSDSMMKKIALKGSLKDIEGIPEHIKKLFVTAHEITPEQHIKMQSVFQKFVDNAVSKTVNFDHAATREEVKEVYMAAYKTGCKGVTIYRDGSRDKQVLNIGKEGKTNKTISYSKIIPRPRPQVTKGHTQRISTGCGNLYVTINECEEGLPFEIFTQMGKAGGCAASQSEAIGRLASLALRSNIEPEIIIKQLSGISCHLPAWENGKKTLSCSDAIAKSLEKYITNKALHKEQINKNVIKDNGNGNGNYKNNGNSNGSTESTMVLSKPNSAATAVAAGICPNCSGMLERIEGCMLCRGCGFSKCE